MMGFSAVPFLITAVLVTTILSTASTISSAVDAAARSGASLSQPADHSFNGPIKLVTVGGTYYSIGFQVGQAMRSIILSRLAQPDYTNFRHILNASKGAAHLNTTLYETTLSVFPEIIDELHGLADGSGVAFTAIWMMNIVDELAEWQRFVMDATTTTTTATTEGNVVAEERHPEYHIMKQFPRHQRGGGPRVAANGGTKSKAAAAAAAGPPSPSDMHCTDVFTNEDPDLPAWGHNEDSGLYDVNHTYMVKARIYNNDSEHSAELLEEFQSYTYAGSVAGKAYQWNAHGLLFSCNALFADDLAFADTQSLPRAIHNRVVLRSRTVDEAIGYSQNLPSTTSYSLNIGYVRKDETAVTGRTLPFQFAQYRNVEIWPLGKRSVREVYPNTNASATNPFHWPAAVPHMKHHFFHCNDFQILNVSYFVDPSSVNRIARLEEMKVPVTGSDIKEMLGDTTNPDYPVYRYGTDGCYTMSTVIFNFETHSLDIYNSNPKNHSKVLSFPMDMAIGDLE